MGRQTLAESTAQLRSCAILPAARCLLRGSLCPSVGQACGFGGRDHGVSDECVWNQNEVAIQLADESLREERRTGFELVPRDGSDDISLGAIGQELLARGFVPEQRNCRQV